MKYLMRQTRDGAVEIVDRSARLSAGTFSSAIESLGWKTALVWYVRTLAWVWIGKGLFNWAIILGIFPGMQDFAAMALPVQSNIVSFACFDLLAAVGLWLAAPWGGAIWLLCAVVESASPLLSPGAASISHGGALLNAVLVVGYFLLSWRAVRARA